MLPSAAPASAATETFDWTLTGPAAGLGGVPYPGSGTLTATVGSDSFTLTSITGTVNGSAIVGPISFFGSDNLIYPTGTSFVDTKGIAFSTVAGQEVSIFGFFPEGTPPSGNAYGEFTSGPGGFGVGTFTLSAVPLPATLPMMAAGLGGLGVFAARRRKKASPRSRLPAAS